MTIPFSEVVNINIALQTSAVAAASFGVGMVLTDDEQIPVDQRVREFTISDYTDLTGNPLIFGQAYFGQEVKPATLKFGRYISEATSPYWIAGSGAASTLLTAWQAMTNVTLVIADSASHTESLTGLNFGAITSVAQVPGVFNTALAALISPTITGLDDATFAWDAMGRLVLTHNAVTGESAVTLSISASTTDTLETALGLTTTVRGTVVAGVDAETPSECLAAVREVTTDFWPLSEIGMDTADQLLLSTAAQSYPVFLMLRSTETDAPNTDTDTATDIGTEVLALLHDRTKCYYTSVTTEFPQAAVMGRFATEQPGSITWGFKSLSGVTESGGGVVNLTSAQRAMLAKKRYDWFDTVGSVRINTSGESSNVHYEAVTAGNKEIRILVFKDFAENGMQVDTINYKLAQDVTAFDAVTLTAIEGIVRKYAQIGLDRRAIVDTAARPIVYDFPTEDDFSASDRASHIMRLLDVFTWPVNSAVNKWYITGSITI